MQNQTSLTQLEAALLPLLVAESESNGHDFGVLEYVTWDAGQKSLGGQVTSLQAKGVITEVSKTCVIDGQRYTQYVLAKEAQA